MKRRLSSLSSIRLPLLLVVKLPFAFKSRSLPQDSSRVGRVKLLKLKPEP